MEIAEREENKKSLFAPLLALGYGFTLGLVGNVIALFFSVFWFFPGHDFFILPLLFLDAVVWFGIGLLQLIGFVYCVIDLSRRQTYQSSTRFLFVVAGLILNCSAVGIYQLITGPQGNGFV